AEVGPALPMNPGNGARVEGNWRGFRFGQEPTVAIAKARDAAHTVLLPEGHHDGANHVVEARAEATAGDDACVNRSRIEEQCAARPGLFEGTDHVTVERGALAGKLDAVEHPFVVPDVVGAEITDLVAEIERGGDARVPEPL